MRRPVILLTLMLAACDGAQLATMTDAGVPTGDAGMMPVPDAVTVQADATRGNDAFAVEADAVVTGTDAWVPPAVDAGPMADAAMPISPDAGQDAGNDAGPATDTTPIVQLALGDTHSCLLRSSGRVTCWGSPTFLGWPVATMTDAVEIAASGTSTFARRTDGSVVRWEGTGAGMTPAASMPSEPTMPDPVYAPGESFPLPTGDYVEIYSGAVHTCGRRADGSVWCWGRNELSQIGRETDPFLTDRHTAFPAGEVLLAGARMNATTLGIGRDHTCVALTDGRVVCWGSNSEGQLGRWVTGLETTEPGVPDWY